MISISSMVESRWTIQLARPVGYYHGVNGVIGGLFSEDRKPSKPSVLHGEKSDGRGISISLGIVQIGTGGTPVSRDRPMDSSTG